METIIIKYHESFLEMSHPVYEEITDLNKHGRRLKKEKAMERIRELGLIKVHHNRWGTIWDTPAQDFLEKWNGTRVYEL